MFCRSHNNRAHHNIAHHNTACHTVTSHDTTSHDMTWHHMTTHNHNKKHIHKHRRTQTYSHPRHLTNHVYRNQKFLPPSNPSGHLQPQPLQPSQPACQPASVFLRKETTVFDRPQSETDILFFFDASAKARFCNMSHILTSLVFPVSKLRFAH